MENDNQNGSRDPNAIRGISLAAPCVDTDTSGDVMYTRAVRNEGTVGAGAVARACGSKYEGVTGTCSYRTELSGRRGSGW